jgi:hypothetical protein
MTSRRSSSGSSASASSTCGTRSTLYDIAHCSKSSASGKYEHGATIQKSEYRVWSALRAGPYYANTFLVTLLTELSRRSTYKLVTRMWRGWYRSGRGYPPLGSSDAGSAQPARVSGAAASDRPLGSAQLVTPLRPEAVVLDLGKYGCQQTSWMKTLRYVSLRV